MNNYDIVIEGARENNLKNVNVRIPKRKITIFTGVSGSGKSSLVFDTISAEAQRQLNETFSAYIRNRLPRFSQPDTDCIENLLTGRYLKQSLPLKTSTREPKGWMTVAGASLHNLKEVTVKIPAGVLTVVTGVAGSGKSTLINGAFLPAHPEAIVIDQSATGTSIRSNPATYTGMMDEIRRLFAAANKVSASLFSFNSKGACSNCQGLGVIYMDLAFLEPVRTTCERCEGKRFSDEVLQYKLNGKSISDVLAMTVREASEFFSRKELLRQLQTLEDVGLGYVTLGQPLSTLSGGECQRIKLAGELHKEGSLYVMDEPTTGLHMSDISRLMDIMNRFVDGGNTVVVIEHNLDVIKSADWIIDMGPEGGHRGGRIIFEGTPVQLAAAEHSITGAYLRKASGG